MGWMMGLRLEEEIDARDIYTLEARYIGTEKWTGGGDGAQLHKGPTLDIHGKLIVPEANPFSASGRCWQETGIHGSYSLDEAAAWLAKIVSSQPKRPEEARIWVEVRITKLTIALRREEGILSARLLSQQKEEEFVQRKRS